MIQRAEEKRDKRSGAKKKFTGADKNMPEFNPAWMEAFMTIMLHKLGGSQTMTVETLEAFTQVTDSKKTKCTWDGETRSFTISAADYEMPVKIEVPEEKKIITNL